MTKSLPPHATEGEGDPMVLVRHALRAGVRDHGPLEPEALESVPRPDPLWKRSIQ